jgi:hypothetical protein
LITRDALLIASDKLSVPLVPAVTRFADFLVNVAPSSNLIAWLTLIVPLAIVTSEYPQSAVTTEDNFSSLERVILPHLIVVVHIYVVEKSL